MRYDTTTHNRKSAYDNDAMIRKNYTHFNSDELNYLRKQFKNLDIENIKILTHAIKKELLELEEIKTIINKKQFKIIDYNYFINRSEERVLIRSKQHYNVEDMQGNIKKCYMKIVVSITNNTIVTVWANEVSKEQEKQNTLNNKYCSNFDIINKKIKF